MKKIKYMVIENRTIHIFEYGSYYACGLSTSPYNDKSLLKYDKKYRVLKICKNCIKSLEREIKRVEDRLKELKSIHSEVLKISKEE